MLTAALREEILRAASTGDLARLPPILTFQSVLDFTVSTRALMSELYMRLPPNGSELVLFDVNRNSELSPLLRSAPDAVLARLLPGPPRRFKTTIIGNVGLDRSDVVERVTDAGETSEWYRPLGLSYPAQVYSLSHVALTFPTTDGLYGLNPDPAEHFGINLGSLTARGERGGLILSLDELSRMQSNPFFPYLISRIGSLIGATAEPEPARLPWPGSPTPALANPAGEGLPSETDTSTGSEAP